MTIQNLYYFSCFEIPNVNFVVFWATNHPFPIGSWYHWKYTVKLIFMSVVCPYSFSCAVIPQSNCAIESTGQNVQAIGRETGRRSVTIYNIIRGNKTTLPKKQNKKKCLADLFIYTGGWLLSISVFKQWPVPVSQMRLEWKIRE